MHTGGMTPRPRKRAGPQAAPPTEPTEAGLRLAIRAAPAVREVLFEAAQRAHETVSRFVLRAALQRAKAEFGLEVDWEAMPPTRGVDHTL